MSKIALEGNASGTGTFTIASPNSNSNYTLTLPSSTGTVVVTGGAQTIEFAAGTAAAPSITFTGDTNTGIFSPGADTIAFSEGGVESMRIDSSGNVGIGTTSPDSRLMLTTPNGTACQLNLSQTAVTNYRLSIPASTDALTFVYGASTERMRIDSSGNVGIGTSSPIAKLDTATTSDNNLNIIRYAESTSGAVFRIRHSYSNTIGTNTLLPGTGGGYQFGRIEFVGATGTDYAVGASIVGIALGSTSSTSMPGVLIFNTTPESSTSPTERARITSGGYFKAADNGTYASSTGAYHEFNQSASGTECLAVESTNASYTSSVFAIAAARNTTNNSFYAISYYNRGATAFKFRVADSGNVTNTNNSYGPISDIKFKKDIVDAGSQWDDIKNIRIRKFRLKDDPEQILQIGVIAQEVELVSPGLVENHRDTKQITKTREVEKTREIPAVLDEEGNEVEPARTETYTETEEYQEFEDTGETYKTFKATVLYMKAVKALQEAMTRIEALEAEVAALKGQ